MTRNDVETSSRQVLALIERLLGIDMSEASLTEEPLFDVSALDSTTDAASDVSYALLAFAIVPLAELDPDDTDVDTLGEVMTRLNSGLVVESGELIATGTTLSRLSDSMATGLATINARLAERDTERPGLLDALSVARNNVATFARLGDDDVVIAAEGASPIQLTTRFVYSLGQSSPGETTSGITRSGDIITDGTVTLAIERDSHGRTSGTFTVGRGAASVRTATLDSQGVVHYTDGSFETLPTGIE
ncbi:MAG: hypothetical protein U5O39_09080 [Gammaproteobacteria bacterium]|nr:hypothetical protein [Gammaproteobacteria bacterium]